MIGQRKPMRSTATGISTLLRMERLPLSPKSINRHLRSSAAKHDSYRVKHCRGDVIHRDDRPRALEAAARHRIPLRHHPTPLQRPHKHTHPAIPVAVLQYLISTLH